MKRPRIIRGRTTLHIYTARLTLPERRHLVQTVSLLGVPSTMALTLWRFGSHLRRVFTSEWLTLLPDAGALPHIAHILGI